VRVVLDQVTYEHQRFRWDLTRCVLQANLGTARLLVQALQQQGLSAAAAKSCIWMVDSKGLILNTRQMLTPEKAEFAQSPSNLPGGVAAAATAGFVQSNSSSTSSSSRNSSTNDTVQRLAAIVAAVQPTALIGAAAVQGAFGQPVIEAVTQVRCMFILLVTPLHVFLLVCCILVHTSASHNAVFLSGASPNLQLLHVCLCLCLFDLP
jgi:malate dehydrogenase (oxaloacetate-decarboxylating)(NADP+)